MLRETNPRLAIRTVLVTTRAAVRSNLSAGRPVAARLSAERGARLLESLAAYRSSGDERVRREYADATRELRSLGQLDERSAAVALSVSDGPLPSRTRPR